jgi:outer membrane biosynthesis protein TonB
VSTRTVRELIEFAAPSKVERLPNGAIVLHRVKYLGAKSSNVNSDGSQNVYTLEARRKSERMYDGAKLFADHPERANPGRERSVREQLGRLRGPFEHGSDGSYATAVLNPKHPLAESIAWSAENSPDDLGLSHNAQGKGRVSGSDCLIEEITSVRSVDLVCAAATTKGLYESRTEDPMLTKERLAELRKSAATEAKLAAHQVALIESVDEAGLLALLNDANLPAEEKAAKALALLAAKAPTVEAPKPAPAETEKPTPESKTTEAPKADEKSVIESLQVKLAALEAREAKAATEKRRDALLAEVKGLTVTESLRDLVRNADTDDRAKALVEEVKRAAFHQQPTSGGRATGATTTQTINSANDLFAALK